MLPIPQHPPGYSASSTKSSKHSKPTPTISNIIKSLPDMDFVTFAQHTATYDVGFDCFGVNSDFLIQESQSNNNNKSSQPFDLFGTATL